MSELKLNNIIEKIDELDEKIEKQFTSFLIKILDPKVSDILKLCVFIKDTNLSSHTKNALKSQKLTFMSEVYLKKEQELVEYRNLGAKGVEEIREWFKDRLKRNERT